MTKENGFFQSTTYSVLVFLVVLTTLAISIMAYSNSKQLKDFLIPKPLDVEDFMAKLRAHPEMQNLKTQEPLNIVQITNANLQNLQTQIRDLDVSFLGNFLVQYKEAIAVYDYLNDTVKGVISIPPPLPQDFFDILLAHPELKNYKTQQPTGAGVIDEATLNAMKQQQPDTFKNAKVGHYLVVYSDRIFVFDYTADKLVVNSKLPEQ